MLMQEAFQRALDQLDPGHEQPRLDARNLKVLQLATGAGHTILSPSAPQIGEAKLVYGARRLARRWCGYARPGHASPRLLDALRDDWVLFARQWVALPSRQRVLLLWDLAAAMQPENLKHDADRGRYLTRQAASHPELFIGLTSCPEIPWPGPASFLVHAVEELEAASASEREEFHRSLHEDWEDAPFWLIHALAEWLQTRYQRATAGLG
jgi:hypothetical protein